MNEAPIVCRHEDGGPVWQTRGIRNTVALGSFLNPAAVQLVKRFGFSGRLVITTDYGFSIGDRFLLITRTVDDTHENMPCCGLNRGRACTLSCLDDVSAGVWLRAWFTDLADEDVNPTKGDPVPVFD